MLIHETWNSTETETRETFELVVWLKDVSYLSNSINVLILFTQAMQRSRVCHLAVRGSEINSDRKRDLPTRAKVIGEVGIFNDAKALKFQSTRKFAFFQSQHCQFRFNLKVSHCCSCLANFDVVGKDSELNRNVFIRVAKKLHL